MKFSYKYKTSDGTRHSGVCDAPTKDAVFTQLRKSGIKPFDVELAPGVLNRIRSFGKRGFAIAVLGVLCLAFGALLLVYQKRNVALNTTLVTLNVTLDNTVRRQPLGDDAVIDQGVRTGWADVFTQAGDRYLASYAIPGVIGSVAKCSASDLKSSLESDSFASLPEDALEARQVMAMVSGMKDEARNFLKDGGKLEAYMRRLEQRQREEIGYYMRAKGEIDAVAKGGNAEAVNELWTKRNAELKRMGIKTILMPTFK